MRAAGNAPVREVLTLSSGTIEPTDFLDVNVLLRYFVQDNPAFTARATALIESERTLRISVVTLAEVGFVLTKFYKVERVRAVDALIDLLNRENIETHEIPRERAIEALLLSRPSGRVSFADALLWAIARSASPAQVWTFDEKFPTDGIQVQQP
jgi:predicted nucleic acid-binding protein